MVNTHVLVVDIGSSGARSAVIADDGTELGSKCADYSFRYLEHGGCELGPTVLMHALTTVIDGALEIARSRGVVPAAVAVDSMWHGVCGVDCRGRITFPILPWADRRSALAASVLRTRLDDSSQHQRTGARLHPMYLPAKILWLSDAESVAFKRTAYFLSPGEYAYSQFFGSSTTSVSMASGTGLFNQWTIAWDDEVFGALPVSPSQFPCISDEPVHGLARPWSTRWPELASVPWFPTIGDGAASSIGAGCTTNSRCALMLGTSGAMRVLFEGDAPSLPGGLWCYRANPREVVFGGALNDGGNTVSWLRSRLRLPAWTRAERALVRMQPGAHGLTVLPFLAGERSPGWSDNATGAIIGLTQATRPTDILRAALESVALRFLEIQGLIDDALPGRREIIATGSSLLHSSLWRQIMADALGRQIVCSAVPNASLRGVALVALRQLGALEPAQVVPAPMGETVTPNSANHDRYCELLLEQQNLYRLLIGGD